MGSTKQGEMDSTSDLPAPSPGAMPDEGMPPGCALPDLVPGSQPFEAVAAVLERLPYGVGLVDAADRLVFANQQARQITGYDPRDIPDVAAWLARAITDPARRQKAAEAWRRDRDQPEVEMEFTARCADGSLRRLQMRQRAWGQGCRLVAIADATSRWRAESALKQSEERFGKLFRSSPTAIVITTLEDGRILEVNETFVVLTGFSRQECVGRTTQEMGFWLDPEERAGFARLLVEQGGSLRDYETNAVVSGGRRRNILISAEVVRIDNRDCIIAACLDITERQEAARALAEGEAKFRTLTETAASGIFIIQGSRFMYMNPAGERITGYGAGELAALNFWDLVHPAFREVVKQRGMARQRGQKVPSHYEFKIVRKDGSERWMDFTAGYIDYQGQPAMLGTAFDITERKLAEERLRLDEARLEALLKLSQTYHAPEQEIIDFALEEAVRLTRSQIGYLGFMNSTETEMTLAARSSKAMAECVVATRPVCYRLSDTGLWGEAVRRRRAVITNDYSSSPLKRGLPQGHIPIRRHMNAPLLDEGRIVVVAGVANKEEPYDDSDVRQVTLLMDAMWKILERRRGEEALRQSEERFRSVAENAPDIIFTLDKDGAFTYVNPAWEKVLGHKPQQVLGRHFVDFARPGDAKLFIQAFKRIRDKQDTLAERDVVLPHVDGRERHFTVSGGPNFDSLGEVTGMVGLLKDVSGQMELEAQLRHAQKMEAIGTLAGGVAHEFNNVLMAIRGYTQLLSLASGTQGASADFIAKIDQSCQRAAELTRKMLTLTRLEVGEKTAVDVNLVAKGVWQLLRQTAPPQIELEAMLGPDLPPVRGNAQQVEQVLLNLALNARDATEAGGRITLATRRLELDQGFAATNPWARPGTYVMVEVADTGSGMPPEVAERIFDPFFTTKEPGKGTGLGLSVAYSILKSHGGHIAVDSRPGQGSRFTVYLPALSGPPQAMGDQPEEPALPLGRGESLLVVDDEPQLREIASEMLATFGYEVDTAGDGQEALQKYGLALAQGRPFRLVILDLAMPVMDGRECLQRLLAAHPAARVLVATGYGGEQAELGQLKDLAWGPLHKPYDLAQLLKQVRQALDG